MSVKCPKCQAENPEPQRFCGDCGIQLPVYEEVAIPTQTIEAPKEELTTGSTFAKRYQIIEELGKGGMGKVYKANDIDIKEKVAIKLIRPEISTDKKTIERFQNELKFARKIRHKNVCQMFDLNREEGTYYISMEYVEGENLRNMIRMSGQLGIGTTISVAKQVCLGLEEAHKLGVIHRDLKPSNIMIDREGNVRIMDFGIAQSLKEKGITGAGVLIGTPEYMSPEHVEGKDTDQRSDIYSLGAILYEMVTGRVPFEGDSALAIAVKHKTEKPKDPKEFNTQLSEDLSSLILRCMEKDKDNRYQTAEELRSGLENIEQSIPTTDRTAPLKKPLTSKEITVTFRAKRVLIPALIIFIIALVGLFLWHPWSGFESPPGDTEKPSIAVLPFEDLSPQKDQDYLCVGLAESLINALSKIQDLRVPARTSSFSFQGKDYIIRDIGERLDVQTVLTGSLQRAENRIRITTQLISTADESLLWSEQYNRELDDVFSIQDEISRSIVETLRVRLGAAERAGLADTYMLLGLFAMMSRDEAAQQAKMAARRALELDGNSSEAQTSFGVILEVFDWAWQEAEREFKRAIDLNPNFFDAHYEYGFLLARLKKLTEAEAELKKALRIDPLSVRGHQVLGRIYTVGGNEEKADEHIKKGDELSSQPYLGENAVDRARGLIEKDGRLPQHLRQLSIAYIESGQDAEARKLLKELEQLYERSDVGNIAYSVTRVYLHYDDYDQALRWLEKSFQRRDPSLISINI